MVGQMIGTIGTAEGPVSAMLCIDADRPDEYMIHVCGEGANEMAVLAKAHVAGGTITLTPSLLYRPAANGNMYAPPSLTEDEAVWMRETRAQLQETTEGLAGTWTGPHGRTGEIDLKAPRVLDSVVAEQCATWEAFKDWAGRVRTESDAVLYRGHGSSQFRLQTTFHRAGLNRLERYCGEVLPMFRHHAEAVLNTRFDLNSGDDFATVLGLAQHHGLPTPLLDWTSSAYVAAFFAFSDAIDSQRSPTDHTHVRVYALTRSFVDSTSPAVVTVPKVKPYVASLAILARLNPRLYAQQGKFLVTNVSPVEGFIRHFEGVDQRQYMLAADIPVGLASKALEDLAFMGLTAATMFPGLDGVCRMMRHEMVFKRMPTKTPGTPAGNAESPPTAAVPARATALAKTVTRDEPSVPPHEQPPQS